jgi:hypothetical protein
MESLFGFAATWLHPASPQPTACGVHDRQGPWVRHTVHHSEPRSSMRSYASSIALTWPHGQ